MAAAVEGEHSSGDLRALCSVVWRQLAAMPPPDTSRGRSMQQALRPHRWGQRGWWVRDGGGKRPGSMGLWRLVLGGGGLIYNPGVSYTSRLGTDMPMWV